MHLPLAHPLVAARVVIGWLYVIIGLPYVTVRLRLTPYDRYEGAGELYESRDEHDEAWRAHEPLLRLKNRPCLISFAAVRFTGP